MIQEQPLAGVGGSFARYVSQNILGMIGISAYILVDTLFISVAAGPDGLTALNLILPCYSVIFAIGAMIGVGFAIQFNIRRARQDPEAGSYFSSALLWAMLASLFFVALGALAPESVMRFFGGDDYIVSVGKQYARIILCFAPFFMGNYILNAFVRNDGAPSLAMAATLISSLFNIVMDYLLMFPLGLGMVGAALATAFSPVVGIGICSLHWLSKSNTLHLRWVRLRLRQLVESCRLGIAAFIGEIASGVTTAVLNYLILGLTGNIGVAAFGVVANAAVVGISIFNGISNGAQPLLSNYYGGNRPQAVRRTLQLALVTALALGIAIATAAWTLAEPIVALFNTQGDPDLARHGIQGMQLYFLGFIPAGFNIAVAGYLSATEQAAWSFAISILRGIVAIIAVAVLMAALWGMTGVWLAFLVAELLTAVVSVTALIKHHHP